MDLLRHLRYFRAVAEELHFGRAAERLGMAQPPLSRSVRSLEEELGARLFDRTSRGVRLTAAGEVLLAESEELLARAERTRTLVTRAHRGEYGVLRIGVPPELPGRVLARVLTRFAAEAPDVQVEPRELGTAEQARLLADRELDAGLLQHPVELTGLVSEPVTELPLGVVVPRGSPLAGTEPLSLAALAGSPLVLFPRPAAPGLYDATLGACRAQGYHPPRVLHAGSPETVLALVIAGRGAALAHAAVAQKEPRVLWRPLAAGGPVWPVSFVRHATAPHPAAGRLAPAATAALRAETGECAPRDPGAPGPNGTPRPWDIVYPLTEGGV
ncbi:LysR substrate-binding domain-containing protein [Streptomyces sp. TRM 70361]|uniref:LysR family transcriptional regulator n=1 Tax=Streptomyces sp. TRM 70361 TaxID=3116553 RepID=UPI002E7B19FE|nr:LysR substrate-binding domain-containing protein [Streptomyces sp. TRM 70361]MEE1941280.1 LysR substrate-binding domain-containing protein [Streptomyces sp. TRM 70361]